MNIKLEAAQLLYARDQARGDAELEATRTLIRITMTSLRRTLADLRAPIADYADLPAALHTLAHDFQERAGITMTCCIEPTCPTPPAHVREALWYVAREALSNVERHAAATRATLMLHTTPDGWQLVISDNGTGITNAVSYESAHYGVVGMRERLALLGGTLRISNGGNGGLIVAAYVPKQLAIQVDPA